MSTWTTIRDDIRSTITKLLKDEASVTMVELNNFHQYLVWTASERQSEAIAYKMMSPEDRKKARKRVNDSVRAAKDKVLARKLAIDRLIAELLIRILQLLVLSISITAKVEEI